MGSIWLTHLPDMLADAGVRVATYKGWETRARSSGGYDAVRAIAIHHTASSASPASDMAYMWENSPDGPIGAIYLDRTGLFTVGAAGAANTMGKGGPLTTSSGQIPLDKGNLYMVAIEAANNGMGETWPSAQVDAYIRGVHGLCQSLDLLHSDVFSHAGYCQPSCPGRKIDPRGPTPSHPKLGGTSGQVIWPDSAFRGYLDALDKDPTPPTPTPTPPTTEDDQMLFLMKAKDTADIYLGDGNTCSVLTSKGFDAIGDLMDQGFSRWHHPHRTGFPLINDRSEVAEMAKDRMLGVMGKQT